MVITYSPITCWKAALWCWTDEMSISWGVQMRCVGNIWLWASLKPTLQLVWQRGIPRRLSLREGQKHLYALHPEWDLYQKPILPYPGPEISNWACLGLTWDMRHRATGGERHKCVAGITRGLGELFSFQMGELTERLLAHTALVAPGEPRSWVCKSTNCVLNTKWHFPDEHLSAGAGQLWEAGGLSDEIRKDKSLPQEGGQGDCFYPGVFPSSSSAVRSRLKPLRRPISQSKVNSCEELVYVVCSGVRRFCILTVEVVLLTERKGRFALVISFPLLERRSQRDSESRNTGCPVVLVDNWAWRENGGAGWEGPDFSAWKDSCE